MEAWAEIRRLSRAEGMPIKAIARRLGVARNTVKRALAAHEPPRYERARKGPSWTRSNRRSGRCSRSSRRCPRR
jgi:transposase